MASSASSLSTTVEEKRDLKPLKIFEEAEEAWSLYTILSLIAITMPASLPADFASIFAWISNAFDFASSEYTSKMAFRFFCSSILDK